MTELTKEQFASSFLDRADEAAVDYHLNGIDPTETIKMAVELSPRRKKFNADQSFKDTTELMASTSSNLVRHRQELLLSMNYETLILLLSRIGYNFEMLAQDRHITGDFSPSGKPENNDPVKGPVFEMIHTRLPGLTEDPRRQRQLDVKTAIKAASERTNVAFPSIPCDLESALRWAADAPDVPVTSLKRAFINYLETRIGDERELNDLHEALSRQLKRERNGGKQEELPMELKRIKDRCMYLKLVTNHEATFKPGKTEAPKRVATYVTKIMADVWDKPNPVEMMSTLANLAADFHPFWQKHGPTYQKLEKNKSLTNKRSGVGGPVSRMGPTWKTRTESFN